MADTLNLSLWFPSFSEPEMMPRLLGVIRQFPFSTQHPGIGFVAVHPVSYTESPIYAQTFDFRVEPERAITFASEFLHDNYAYEFEALWNLWLPPEADEKEWTVKAEAVRFIAHGLRFDDGMFQQYGHVQVDFGLDTPFLAEDIELSGPVEQRVRANVQKLVSFTTAVEKKCGIIGRVLWSESEENLAQKLISRLQQTH
jgi:hypothetical protein